MLEMFSQCNCTDNKIEIIKETRCMANEFRQVTWSGSELLLFRNFFDERRRRLRRTNEQTDFKHEAEHAFSERIRTNQYKLGSSFAFKKVVVGVRRRDHGSSGIVPRFFWYKIRCEPRKEYDRSQDEWDEERHGGVTGRHKVPFVPIKTSGTEYVRRYKEKRKGAARWDGTMTTRYRAKIQLRSNRSFRRSRLPTKFAIYDPGKPKRTSFHDAGRYLPPVTIRSNLETRVVRRNEKDIGRGALILKEPGDAADMYVHVHTCVFVCIYMRMRVYARLSK